MSGCGWYGLVAKDWCGDGGGRGGVWGYCLMGLDWVLGYGMESKGLVGKVGVSWVGGEVGRTR